MAPMPRVALTALALLAGGAAGAQEAPARLEAVTVTAQKTEQDAQRVPMSLSVIDGDKIARSHITTLDEVSRFAANTQISQVQAFIRGIGTGSNTFGFDPSVAVFVDGVYIGRGSSLPLPLFDLARVEVVRGPQGTLLGKNTLGGAILVGTTDPAGEYGAAVDALAGELDPYAFQAQLNLPLGEDWGLRISGLSEQSSGYIHNSTRDDDELGRRNRGLRAKLAWHPHGPTSAQLTLETTDSSLKGIGQELSAATPSSLALYRLYDRQAEANAGDGHGAFDKDNTGAQRQADSATLKLSWNLDNLQITSLSNAFHSQFGFGLDVDYSPLPLLGVEAREDYRQWSQELRADATHGDLRWLAGVYFSGARLAVDNVISALPEGSAALASGLDLLPPSLSGLLQALPALPSGIDPLSDHSNKSFRQDANSAAAYAQARLAFAEDWALTAGLRWTWERKQVQTGIAFDKTGILFRAALGQEPYDESRERRETDLSPRLALEYTWSPDLLLYAAAARGYKSGGYNDFAATAEALEFAGERLESVEAGFKAMLDERRMSLNLALFDSRLRDMQVSAYDGAAFYVQNAAAARVRGAELESRWLMGSHWRGWASLGYLDARYLSFPNAPVRSDQSGDTQDLGGQPLTHAPRLSGGGGLEYEWPIGALRLTAGLDALYRSLTYLNLDDDIQDAQPAYTVLNAALILAGADDRWSLRLNVLNLTDRYSRNASGDVPLFAGNHSVDPDPPRRWTAGARWTW